MNHDTIYYMCKYCDIHTYIQIIKCDKHLLKLKHDEDILKSIIDKYFHHHQINIAYNINLMKACYYGKIITIISDKIYDLRIYPWDTYDGIYKMCTSNVIFFEYYDYTRGGARVVVKKFGYNLHLYHDPYKYLIEENVYNQVTHIRD